MMSFRLTAFCVFFSTVAIGAPMCWSQGFLELFRPLPARPAARQVDGAIQDRRSTARQKMIERSRDALRVHMDLRIDELDRACRLTDKQRRKLHVASKGAIERVLSPLSSNNAGKQQAGKQQAGKQRNDVQLDIAVDQGAVDQGAVVEKPLVEFAAPGQRIIVEADRGGQRRVILWRADGDGDAAVVQANELELYLEDAMNGPSHRSLLASVDKEPIWTKAVAAILTDDQKSRYANAQDERTAFKRKAIIDDIVARIDNELFLSGDQRKPLAKAVKDSLKNQLDSLPAGSGHVVNGVRLSRVAKQLSKSRLESILTTAQLAKWERISQAERELGAERRD